MLDTFHMNMEEDDLPQAIRNARDAADAFPGEREPSRLPWHRAISTGPRSAARWRKSIIAGPITLEPFRRTDHRLSVPLAQWRPPAHDEDADLAQSAASAAREPARGTSGDDAHRLDRLRHACRRDAAAATRAPAGAPGGARAISIATRLATVGDRYGVAARYTDGRAAVEAGGIDAVGMAVGPRAARRARRGCAARAACRCIMEKPPAATAAEAQVLAELAAERPENPASSAS